MNCKPGDLAVIIASDSHVNPDSGGVLCDVIDHPPSKYFALPDGTRAASNSPLCDRRVIRLHRTIVVRWTNGELHRAIYAVCPDSKLRPIRDNDGEDETLQWANKPEDQE